jgi:hypothetical protein
MRLARKAALAKYPHTERKDAGLLKLERVQAELRHSQR